MDATNQKILDAAARQQKEEGRVTYRGIEARTGLGTYVVQGRVKRMRYRGAFPHTLAIQPPGPKRRGERTGPPAESYFRKAGEFATADESVRLAIDVELMKSMRDARAEIDDPRVHPLVPPRSLPRAEQAVDLRTACRRLVRQMRRTDWRRPTGECVVREVEQERQDRDRAQRANLAARRNREQLEVA